MLFQVSFFGFIRLSFGVSPILKWGLWAFDFVFLYFYFFFFLFYLLHFGFVFLLKLLPKLLEFFTLLIYHFIFFLFFIKILFLWQFFLISNLRFINNFAIHLKIKFKVFLPVIQNSNSVLITKSSNTNLPILIFIKSIFITNLLIKKFIHLNPFMTDFILIFFNFLIIIEIVTIKLHFS